jgi:copper chaperone CopZ
MLQRVAGDLADGLAFARGPCPGTCLELGSDAERQHALRLERYRRRRSRRPSATRADCRREGRLAICENFTSMSAADVTTQTPLVAPAGEALEQVELDVSGMTCSSCAARVQRALSREPGVTEALVNYATGRATVEVHRGALDAERLVTAVKHAGYDASPVPTSASEQANVFDEQDRSDGRVQAGLLRRIVVAVPFATAIAVLSSITVE